MKSGLTKVTRDGADVSLRMKGGENVLSGAGSSTVLIRLHLKDQTGALGVIFFIVF